MNTNSKTITYCGGFWSTNIGNSFFDLGIIHLLEKACPNDRVIFCDEQPGNYWTDSGCNPINSLNYLNYIDSEYVAIAGPLLNKDFPKLWGNTFEIFSKKRIKIILISVGCSAYTKDELEICRSFLKKYPLYALVSRDEYTYTNYKDLATHSYNGICCAFYAPDIFQTQKTNIGRYVVLNFDGSHFPPLVDKVIALAGMENEPMFELGKSGKHGLNFDFLGELWNLDYNYKPIRLKNLFRPLSVKSPNSIGNFKIIRTKHRANSMSRRVAFSKTNTFISDIPYNYLNIYGNAEVTFSNRVHACVATLAFGKPAMFFSNTPRGRLFERFEHLADIKKRPVSIPKNVLESEKTKQLEFLSGILND